MMPDVIPAVQLSLLLIKGPEQLQAWLCGLEVNTTAEHWLKKL